jgi:hypothetical protein
MLLFTANQSNEHQQHRRLQKVGTRVVGDKSSARCNNAIHSTHTSHLLSLGFIVVCKVASTRAGDLGDDLLKLLQEASAQRAEGKCLQLWHLPELAQVCCKDRLEVCATAQHTSLRFHCSSCGIVAVCPTRSGLIYHIRTEA